MKTHRQSRALYAAFLSLMVITTIFFHGLDHYDVSTVELLAGSIEAPQARWSVLPKPLTLEDEGLVFREAGIRSLTQRFAVPESSLLQARVQVSSQQSSTESASQPTGRADLYGRIASEKFDWLQNIGLFHASTGTQIYTQVIALPAGVQELQIEVERLADDVGFELQSASVREAQPKGYRAVVELLLLACWFALCVVILIWLWQRDRRVLIAALVTVLLVLLFIPEAAKLSLQQFFSPFFESADHVVLFFLLGLVIFYRDSAGLLAAVAFVLATELLQNFTSHRDVLLSDVLANLIGLLVAYLTCRATHIAQQAWQGARNHQ